MGRQKRDGNHSPLSQNNLIQDLQENEENGYPVPESNKVKINDTNKPRDAHKSNIKEEILQVTTENFMEMILDTVKQNVQDALKKF
jgi:hypothetical protein